MVVGVAAASVFCISFIHFKKKKRIELLGREGLKDTGNLLHQKTLSPVIGAEGEDFALTVCSQCQPFCMIIY